VTCTNGILDPDETDVDCGGSGGCPRCTTGRVCEQARARALFPLIRAR
jgi:hypothetical protein